MANIPTNNLDDNDPRAREPFMLVNPMLVINYLNRELVKQNPGLTTLFDPTLTYQEVMRGVNAIRSRELFIRPDVANMKDESEPLGGNIAPSLNSGRPSMPIFAFNRTAMTAQMDSQIWRGALNSFKADETHNPDGVLTDIRMFNGTVELPFRYYAADAAALEAFEQFYTAGLIFKNINRLEFQIDFLEKYLPNEISKNWFANLEWYPLSDLEFNQSPVYFSISGSVRISTGFLSAMVRKGRLVEIINLYLEHELDPTKPWREQPPTYSVRRETPT